MRGALHCIRILHCVEGAAGGEADLRSDLRAEALDLLVQGRQHSNQRVVVEHGKGPKDEWHLGRL